VPRWTAESREQYSAVMKAMPRSQEWKDNISKAKKGKSLKPLSPETKAKLSEIGKKKVFTEEHRQNISLALAGRKPSPGCVAKAIEARKGKEHTEATKLKMSLAHLNRNIEHEKAYVKSGGTHAGVWMRCLNSEGVFARQLDAAGIEWMYEPRRFRLSIGSYLPDFYLPQFDIWVEVKGSPRQHGKWPEKIRAFRQETGKCLVIVFQSELESRKYHMSNSIVGQADYYGLPEQSRPEPPSEQHLAELLKKPPMFSGPPKLAGDDKSDEWRQMEETYGEENVHPRGPGEWDD
jgi:hypothetical protein